MKKAIQFLFVSLLILTFASCSSDDNNQPDSSVVLLKKMDSDVLGYHATYNFDYNGRKLTRVNYEKHTPSMQTGYDKYYYTGDLITEIRTFNGSNQSIFSTFFTYNANNQLEQVVKLNLLNSTGTKTVFTYNANGTVDTLNYTGSLQAQTVLSEVSEKFFIENNNIVKIEFFGSTTQTAMDFEYDTANNPMSNVVGMDKIKLHTYDSDGKFGVTGNLKNVITHFATVESSQVDFELVYNDKNYPVSSYSTETSPGPYHFNFEYYK
ncbi:hypothetical protein WMW71_08965 [Flavobacterium buctense]|uniref:DUF4595 domain-containing protein n=1 Tax=Flavobacterium buctense TaxID=1648146 RepID=A0ABU9E3F2_9FLAO|nr:hypothetical protein [Flavobacterium buctense]